MNHRKELLYKQTAAEKAVCAALGSLGVRYIRQKPLHTAGGRTFYADVYIPSLRLVIEVDGRYHFTPEQQRRDSNRSACLRRLGLHVYRIANAAAYSPRNIAQLLRRYEARAICNGIATNAKRPLLPPDGQQRQEKRHFSVKW